MVGSYRLCAARTGRIVAVMRAAGRVNHTQLLNTMGLHFILQLKMERERWTMPRRLPNSLPLIRSPSIG
jgi:hypothetical protein